MPDLNFQDAGLQKSGGSKRLTIFLRRLVLKLLRPVFDKQVAILKGICERLDDEEWGTVSLGRQVEYVDGRVNALSDQLQTSIALGWDYVATVRRLAVLEDRVEALMEARERAEGDGPGRSVPFPAPEAGGLGRTGTDAP